MPIRRPLPRRSVQPGSVRGGFANIECRLQGIDAEADRIQTCEERLALSASLTAGLLLDAWEVEPSTMAPSLETANPIELASHSNPVGSSSDAELSGQGDLLQQANQLRSELGLDGHGQTVAVIDSGVAWDHVALGGGFGPGYRVVGGWDFAESDADPYDDGPAGFHGSHVAALLAGQSEGFVGVAPGANIVALRVFDDAGHGQLPWIESALRWVHENQNEFAAPITTVNLSVGAVLTGENRLEAMAMIEDELQLLREDNILVFAASGNQFDRESGDEQSIMYPASSPTVVAVGSVSDDGRLSEFAQREPGMFAAQGESINSAVPDHVFGWDGRVDDFAQLDGTSMATPQVAASSMLVRQAMINRGLEPTADEILDQLRQWSTHRIDPLTGENYHTIDLRPALHGADSQTPAPLVDHYHGTNESEYVELDLSDGVSLLVGDRRYALDEGGIGTVPMIDVGGGDDTLHIIGSPQAERLVMHANASEVSRLSRGELQIHLRGFENVVFVGGGGSDRATLFDSTGDDSLMSHPSNATLSGTGYRFEVTEVSRIYVHATAGGNDAAFLHDSEEDDSLAVRPQFTSLQGGDSFQLAYGFERVYAYADAGGFDAAELGDSEGDDTVSVSATRTMIAGPGYQVSARGFDSVIAQANAGGDDVARIYADQTSGRWNSTPDMVRWSDQRSERVARNFERAEVFEDFQPIEIKPLALLPRSGEDHDERRSMESASLRRVFEDFGRA